MCGAKASDSVLFLKSFGIHKINKLVVNSKILTNNFAGLVTSGETFIQRGFQWKT
jgi:hypothetical protein